ncbi:hypothetical protein, partial [uncultured Dubosiella sp.]|uniref:hypothetical protein n=1 Tax=uncultured Dubosiella sp. TaxID=1937011 RepID=UPI00266F819B
LASRANDPSTRGSVFSYPRWKNRKRSWRLVLTRFGLVRQSKVRKKAGFFCGLENKIYYNKTQEVIT